MDDAATDPAPQAAPAVRRRRGWLWAGGALLLVGGGLWLMRGSLADRLVADQLSKRGVVATYRIDSIGLRTQRLSDIVLGDPKRPDLVARSAELDIGWTWQGPVVEAVRARGVRLYGRWDGQRLRLGEVDKLLPPPSDKAFELPDLVLGLDDARARIDTPWGALGLRIDGSGPLRRNFLGTAAVTATELTVADCGLTAPTAYGRIRTEGGAMRFAGPVRFAGLACANAGVRTGRGDIDAALTLSSDLARWSGNLAGGVDRIRGADAAIARTTLDTVFEGSAAGNQATFTLGGNRLALAGSTIARATLRGSATLAKGDVTGTAALRCAGAALDPAQRRRWTAALVGEGHPLVALGRRYGRAAIDALADVAGGADLALADQALTITNVTGTGRGGVRLSGDATSRVRIARGAKGLDWQADGRWQLAGGGIARTALALRAGAGGALDGRLTLAPLVAGATRLTLTPVTLTRRGQGPMRLTSRALFSGPVAGGQVKDLAMALDVTIDRTGQIALAGGCQRVTLASAALAGARLGGTALQLCSAPGQPLIGWRNGQLVGEVRVPQPRLTGRTGDSAFVATATRFAYRLAGGQLALDALAVVVGEGDAATNFTALRIDGAASASGFAGRLEQAAGEIGTIPLAMTEIGGDWHWDGGLLTLNGGLTVSDQQAPPRFNPLVSTDASLRFQDGVIDAAASFAEKETGTPIGRSELRHAFASASGSADLLIMSMRFNDGFQPVDLTPLALGVIANTEGTLAGRGRIDWTPDGVTSTGTFTTAGSNFAAAFGSVRGASTTIVFDDLLGLRSAPGQRISLDEVNPGFPVFGGTIDYQLLDATRIQIEGGRWPFAGGELVLKPSVLDFDVNAVRRLEFELRGVDAAVFLTELGFENINASGVFDGVLPVEFSGLGGRIVDGKLVARPGGGQVAYVGELSNYNLGTFANFAFNMLKALRYEDMTILLNGDLDGEMATDVKIVGLKQGDGASRNLITRQIEKLPIVFNVRINAPFRQLLSSAKSFYDPSILIDQNLPALIAAQKSSQDPPVQPAESETVP